MNFIIVPRSFQSMLRYELALPAPAGGSELMSPLDVAYLRFQQARNHSIALHVKEDEDYARIRQFKPEPAGNYRLLEEPMKLRARWCEAIVDGEVTKWVTDEHWNNGDHMKPLGRKLTEEEMKERLVQGVGEGTVNRFNNWTGKNPLSQELRVRGVRRQIAARAVVKVETRDTKQVGMLEKTIDEEGVVDYIVERYERNPSEVRPASQGTRTVNFATGAKYAGSQRDVKKAQAAALQQPEPVKKDKHDPEAARRVEIAKIKARIEELLGLAAKQKK